jgi:hypothetical protein
LTQYSEDALYDSQVTHYALLMLNLQPQISDQPLSDDKKTATTGKIKDTQDSAGIVDTGN